MDFFLKVHGKEPLPTLDASEVQEMRKELVAIRDKVNTLLDAIDGNPKRAAATLPTEPPPPTSAKVSRAVETASKNPPEGIIGFGRM